MDGVKMALGSIVMTVVAGGTMHKDRKEWRARVHM